MNLQKLSIFVTLVETRKMSETAARLQLTAPTVSFHIRSLEKEYRMKLFRTNAGGYRLTSGERCFIITPSGLSKQIGQWRDR